MPSYVIADASVFFILDLWRLGKFSYRIRRFLKMYKSHPILSQIIPQKQPNTRKASLANYKHITNTIHRETFYLLY